MGWHAYAKLRHVLNDTFKIGAGQQPTRASNAPGRRSALFGLAGGGVYPAGVVTNPAVRSYRTFSPLPRTHLELARKRVPCPRLRGHVSTVKGKSQMSAGRYSFCGTVPRIAPGGR